MTISSFSGQYAFLSNFYASPVTWEGIEFPTAEHAFQARKTSCAESRQAIAKAPTPRIAKQLGQKVELFPDWDQLKIAVMTEIVELKFAQNPDLAQALRDTGNDVLVEGNTWHDQFWGDCTCSSHRYVPGANALGIILMNTRLKLGSVGSGNQPGQG